MIARILLRLGVALVIVGLHQAVGGWLAARDPLHELISGDRVQVGAALLLLAPLRLATWFVVPPWLVAGTLSDALDRRRRVADGPDRVRSGQGAA